MFRFTLQGKGSGFRVQSLGFQLQASGSRVWVFRISGVVFRLRVEGSGFRFEELGFRF